jgi:hypothetical protein
MVHAPLASMQGALLSLRRAAQSRLGPRRAASALGLATLEDEPRGGRGLWHGGPELE